MLARAVPAHMAASAKVADENKALESKVKELETMYVSKSREGAATQKELDELLEEGTGWDQDATELVQWFERTFDDDFDGGADISSPVDFKNVIAIGMSNKHGCRRSLIMALWFLFCLCAVGAPYWSQ